LRNHATGAIRYPPSQGRRWLLQLKRDRLAILLDDRIGIRTVMAARDGGERQAPGRLVGRNNKVFLGWLGLNDARIGNTADVRGETDKRIVGRCVHRILGRCHGERGFRPQTLVTRGGKTRSRQDGAIPSRRGRGGLIGRRRLGVRCGRMVGLSRGHEQSAGTDRLARLIARRSCIIGPDRLRNQRQDCKHHEGRSRSFHINRYS